MEKSKLAPQVTKVIFDLGAFGYDHLTRQIFWRNHIEGILEEAPRPAERILDLGCGPGNSTFVLAAKFGPEVKVVGVDISEKMLQRAEKNAGRLPSEFRRRLEFVRADASELPFPADHFDLAFGHSFLYLVTDRKAVLSEALRVLKPGGTLMLMEPSRRICPFQIAKSSLRELAAFGSENHPLKYPISTAKFALSIVTWRMMVFSAGGFDSEEFKELAERVGFTEVKWRKTLAGLGTVYMAKKPELSEPTEEKGQ